MDISLRRAAQIRSDIEKLFTTLPSTPVMVSVYETDVGAAIETKRQEVLDAAVLRSKLESVLFGLRRQIGRQNAESGVSDLLADQALLETQRRRLEKLATSRPVQIKLVRGKVVTARERVAKVEQGGYFGKSSPVEEIAADVLQESDIVQIKQELADIKRKLREVSGALIDLNSRTTVELTDAEVELLADQGVL
ncbi:MAG TPA: hypothetical protein VNU46_01605 [Gemmatimonadaceae bacterium]|jgi:hypothetical protein|nr:hypothetical protein [Gemmatimonadaceae bacterium]